MHVCTMHYTVFTLSPAASTATGEVHVLWNVTLNHLEHVVITTPASSHETCNDTHTHSAPIHEYYPFTYACH